MTTKENLQANVASAKNALAAAVLALEEFECLPENNVFASLEAAEALEDTLRDRARADCEGSYNLGNPSYEQEFIVDGKHHVAKIDVEYNRHDKTYYYIDSATFSIRAKEEPAP